MFKTFFSFLILSTAFLLFAAPAASQPAPQERFDKLAARKTFGEADILELRSIMESERQDEKVDCTYCPDGLTWFLVENKSFDEVAWLFDHKADFGVKDKDGMTLLHSVCRDGQEEFAELLLDLGAEVDLPDDEGRTALHYAVMSGNSKLVETLLRLGSDPNKLTKNMETPLHFAAQYSGIGDVEFLVEHGASIKAINWKLVENLKDQRRRQDRLYYDSDEEHISALKAALGLKTPESLESDDDDEDNDEYDYEDEDEDEEDDGGERYADAVADSRANSFSGGGKKGKEAEAPIDVDNIPFHLLPRDVNDAATIDGVTALHLAAAKGDIAIVRYLIEHGADIKAQDHTLNRSVIHFAAENGNIDCIKYLAEKGADLQDKDSYGATALHYAARANNLDAIKFLVGKKVDYTARDYRGWTAMHYAASGAGIEMIQYLLAKGLNINELNYTGRTPLFFARNNRELRKFMVSKGAK